MNEEKGGGRRPLEGPEVAPAVPRQRGGPGETAGALEAGGGPEGSQAGPCHLSRPQFPQPLSGGLSWPELPVSLGGGVSSEAQASQGCVGLTGGGWVSGGARVGVGGALPC